MDNDKYKLEKPEICILCGDEMTHLHDLCNPEPLAKYEDGRCCKLCDNEKVIPARLEMAIEYYKKA